MKRLIIMTVALAFLLCLSFPAYADRIDRRAEEATNIVVGKIKQVKSFYATNKWGDNLIMSEVTLKVDKVNKGDQVDEVTFIVEGGAVGDIVLRVSSVPLFEEGEELILFLKKKNGRFEYIDSHKFGASGGKAKPAPPSKPTLECCKTFASWPNQSTVNYYINPNIYSDPVDDPLDTVDFLSCIVPDIDTGADAWYEHSKIDLHNAGTTDIASAVIDKNEKGDDDNKNVIFFRSPDDDSGTTIAVTYIWYYRKGREIFAFDMVFYDKWAFFSKICGPTCPTTNYSTEFYLQTIAAHEFGHAIGLDHNRCTDSLMYPYATDCDGYLLSVNDEKCAESLYGVSSQ